MNKNISLHLNSEYSLLESTIKISNLIDFAKKNELEYLVLTDHNYMSGASDFIKSCLENNIKPIVGLDLDVEDNNQTYRLILLPQNYEGFKHLMFLSSKINHDQKVTLDLIEDKNIFIIDHPNQGFYNAKKTVLDFNNFFIGSEKPLLDLKNNLFVQETKILASEQENEILEILYKIDNHNESKKFDCKPYPVNIDMNQEFVKRSQELLKKCFWDHKFIKQTLPNFIQDKNVDPFDYLVKIINENIVNLKDEKYLNQEYQERLKFELDVIKKLKFENYFLIIQDLVNWSKKNKILVGPGRGSVAGSLVAFLLNITEVDPLEFDLLFERFLNENRVSMPDIDLDFQDNRRFEVIQYIYDKYGHENTASIATFQRLGAKMAIRDLGRNMGIPIYEIDQISKTIPNNVTLDQALKESVQFRAKIKSNPIYKKLFDSAKLVEGMPRQFGTHAAGIVISNQPIFNSVPTMKNGDELNQTQFTMDNLENYGLIKIDILGLKNLTILQEIQNEVYKNFNKFIDIKKISLEDKKTNDLLNEGNTNGIFQLESFGMKKTISKFQIDSVKDLATVISLYRPGPMENIDEYIKNKHNKKWIKIDPSIDFILEPTFGILVYQEQIMQIVQKFANLSFAESDLFRKYIGKKDSESLESLKKNFINKSLANGHDIDTINKVYDYILKFANYGFNKSHAIAYAILGYRLAYLKSRFPLEFYTALLNSSISSVDSFRSYVDETKSRGLEIVGPEIQLSSSVVYNDKKNKIFLPFVIIKGIGNVAAKKLEEFRSNLDSKDLIDIIVEIKKTNLGQANLETLIKANVFRNFYNVETLLSNLNSISRYAQMISKDPGLIDLKPNIHIEKQNLEQEILYEKQLFGFPINVFETSPYEKEIKLGNLKVDLEAKIVVFLEKSNQIYLKNKDKIGIITCYDSSRRMEIIVPEFIWSEVNYKTAKNKLILINVKKVINNNQTSFVLQKMWKEMSDE